MTQKASPELIQAIAVTAELTATEFSRGAAEALAAELAGYPEHQVMTALRRCRRELTGRLSLAAILSRVDDGRPTPEIAWSQVCALTERDTIVGTTEQIEAFACVSAMLDAGESIPARMAFLERYKSLVAKSKDEGLPVRYMVSAGFDAQQREAVVREAHEQGLLTDQQASQHMLSPPKSAQKLIENLGGQPLKALP